MILNILLKKIMQWLASNARFGRLFLHVTTTILSFFLLAVLARKITNLEPMLIFVFIAILCMLLGWLHEQTLWKIHPWLEDSFLNGFLLTLCIFAFGVLTFEWFFLAEPLAGVSDIMLGVTLTFILPFMIGQAIRKRNGILPAPGGVIEDLERARASISFLPQDDKRLLLNFRQDYRGYLPRKMIMAVNPEDEHRSLLEFLSAAIYFNNEKALPFRPIDTVYLRKKEILPFVFCFQRGNFLFKRFILPSTPVSNLKFYWSNIRDEQGRKLKVRCASIIITRYVLYNETTTTIQESIA